ncbi:MAG: cyclic nucleotide-binding domain-containing protein [Betaproteobacteria bacterium]
MPPRVGPAASFTDRDISEALHASNMFASATADELLVLSSSCRVENLPTGAVILQEGDSADDLYLLLAGELLVYTHDDLGNELPLARFSEAYRFVGEQAFLAAHRARRSASELDCAKK